MLIWFGRGMTYRTRCARQARVQARLQHGAVDRIIDLDHHLGLTGVRMLEPLGAGAADSAFTAGFGNEVFPLLGCAGFEQFSRPLQIFFVERWIVQNALNVSQPFAIPVCNPGSLDKFAKVLVATAVVHPATVRTLELPAPDAGARGHGLSWIMHVRATSTYGGEHAVKQGHLDALAKAATLPRIQGYGDTDRGLERGVD